MAAPMATLLLEVGTEDLPASFIASAIDQWRSRLPGWLQACSLAAEQIQVFGTPRRLAVLVKGLPDRQPDQLEDIKGPPVQSAFKDGKPTKAAEGFARKQGVQVEDFEIRDTDKGEFIFVHKVTPGQPTATVLAEQIPTWLASLEGKRFMRWGSGDFKFSRPIRWLVALLDDQVLPIVLENGSHTLSSDRVSQGHRVLHPEPITIPQAADYLAVMADAFVMVDPAQRQQVIQAQTQSAAEKINGRAVISPDLLAEVIHLVEYPTAVVGQFDTDFLALPPEVIITEMESHQRYFPVVQTNSEYGKPDLLPYFITISNGDPAKSDVIAAGNQRVIRARLADGKFFFEADRAIPLADYLPKLETVTFQEALGSMREKVDRICQAAQLIAGQLALPAAEQAQIQRAALLCKADLVTQMVGEFPELQGVMGQKYALTSGEPEVVANAIFEHYLPRGAEDEMPQSLVGQVVGLADRLDTLVSIFSLGMVPTGSSDPFALRRAAIAVVNIAWFANLPLNLKALLSSLWQAAQELRPVAAELPETLADFFLQRIRTLLQEEHGIDYDLVNAVLGEEDESYRDRALMNLVDVRDRAVFLQTIRQEGTLAQIYETVNRAARLAKQGGLDTETLDPAIIQSELFQQPSEQAFYDALVRLLPETQAAQHDRDYCRLVAALQETATIVADFFDGPQSVLVMDEDLEIRQNRLNLLGLLRNHARVLADFGAIVKA